MASSIASKRKTAPERVLPQGYTWSELHRLAGTTLRAGISTLVRGHPGVGKSTVAAALAAEMGLPLIDIRLAQRDPVDLCGVWFPDKDKHALEAYPPRWALEAAERPCFIFLDEINAAVTKLHQAAAYQIVLEKRVGEVRFHPETVVMAAGNLDDDHAIVTPLSSALCNRFAHFTLRVDAASWLSWAADAGLNPSILAYVARHGEEALYANDGEAMAFPTPRSWEMASRVLAVAADADRKRLVSACVGTSAAEQFFSWLRLNGQVDVARIIRKGQAIDFTTGAHAEPSFVHATAYAVGAWLRAGEDVSDAQLPNILTFLRSPGLDPEYAFLTLRQINHNAALMKRLRQLPAFRVFAGEQVDLQLSNFQ